MSRYADYLRWLYKGGRPNGFARLQNRASGAVFAAGLLPHRAAMLEVRGRRTGRMIKFPVVVAADRHASLGQLDRIAADYPVFRVRAEQA